MMYSINNDDPPPLPLHEEKYDILADDEKMEEPSWIPYLAAFVAFGSEMGNIPNAYFNFLTTVQGLTNVILEFSSDNSISEPAKLGCYLIAIWFMFHTLANDLLLIIPIENYQLICNELSANSQKQSATRGYVSKILRGIFFTIIYTAFSILSANSAVGAMEIFYMPILKKTLGVIVAIICTVLGVSYAHFYYYDIIMETINFFKDSFLSPCQTFKNIFKRPAAALQVIKSFSTISVYYTTLNTFYLASLAESLSSAFEFPVHKNILSGTMMLTGVVMLTTNVFIRFLAVKKPYFIVDSPAEAGRDFFIDFILESIIAGAGIVFLGHYTGKTYLALSAGAVYLGIGIQSFKYKNAVVSEEKISRIAVWINLNARIHKSFILLMSALYKLQSVFKNYADIDFNMNFFDILCLTIIFGGPIGVNKSALDKSKLSRHVNYLYAKYKMRDFGTFGCLFHSAKEYPSEKRIELEDILKPA